MAMSTVGTYFGSVVQFGAVAFEDDTITMTISLTRESTQVDTWGGSSSGLGSLKGTGSIECLYNSTVGSPYETIQSEMITPTTGGIAVVYRPEGTGTGLPEWNMNAKLTGFDFGGTATDNKTGKFTFDADNIVVTTQP